MTPVLHPGDLVYIAVPNPRLGTERDPLHNSVVVDIATMLRTQGIEVISSFQTDNPRLTHPEIIAIFRKQPAKSEKEAHD